MGVTYAELFFESFILLLPFLYESSHVFRYYFKFFIYYSVVSTFCVILIPVFCFTPKDVKNLLLASTWCKHISRILGIKWILRGREHLEQDMACVIVANHQSCIDILGMFDVWHVMNKCTVVAKKQLQYFWPLGLACWLCGLIFIDRIDPNKSKKILNDAADKITTDKTKVWIFPEGTRRNTGELHPFKKGAFHMAILAQLPILPVVYSRYYFLDKDGKTFDAGNVIITTLPSISTKGMTTDDLEKLMEETNEKMKRVFEETSKEIEETRNESYKDAEYCDTVLTAFLILVAVLLINLHRNPFWK